MFVRNHFDVYLYPPLKFSNVYITCTTNSSTFYIVIQFIQKNVLKDLLTLNVEEIGALSESHKLRFQQFPRTIQCNRQTDYVAYLVTISTITAFAFLTGHQSPNQMSVNSPLKEVPFFCYNANNSFGHGYIFFNL